MITTLSLSQTDSVRLSVSPEIMFGSQRPTSLQARRDLTFLPVPQIMVIMWIAQRVFKRKKKNLYRHEWCVVSSWGYLIVLTINKPNISTQGSRERKGHGYSPKLKVQARTKDTGNKGNKEPRQSHTSGREPRSVRRTIYSQVSLMETLEKSQVTFPCIFGNYTICSKAISKS